MRDLLATAKQYWSEGSLHAEAVAAEEAGTLEPVCDEPVPREVCRILTSTLWDLPVAQNFGFRIVDRWNDDIEYEEREDERPDDEPTEGEVVLYAVPTADAGVVRVAVYRDNEKSSIDRVATDAGLPDACRMWRERWGDEAMPVWASAIADSKD